MEFEKWWEMFTRLEGEGVWDVNAMAAAGGAWAYQQKRIAQLQAQVDTLQKALVIGGRECAEIEFGEGHDYIDRLARGTWAGWLEKAREQEE